MNDRSEFEEGLAGVRAQIEEGDLDAAEAVIESLRAQCVRTEEHGQVFGLSMVCAACRAEDADDAATALRREIRAYKEDPWFLTAAGNELSDAGEYDLAEIVYRAVIDFDADKPAGHLNLGLCLVRDDRREEAIESFRRAVALDPDCADAHIQIAHCAHELDDIDAATVAYRRYLELNPRDAHEWIWLGIAESDAARYAAAFDAFRAAGEIDPDNVSLHYNWLITAGRADRPEDLAACVEKLEALAPDDWRTMLGRMYLAEDDGRLWQGWEHAQAGLDRAVEESADAEDDPSLAASAAAAVLAYAIRNQLEDHVGPVLERVYEFDLFSRESLRCMRELDDRRSANAYHYSVMLAADIGDLDADDDGPASYFRGLVVVAESEADARKTAIAFEDRCKVGSAVRVEHIEREGESGEAYLGVLWCGPRGFYAIEPDGS